MGDKIILQMSIGNFVFNSQGKMIDRGSDLLKLKEKYSADIADSKIIPKLLAEFRQKEYLERLRNACIESAKKSIKASVSQDLMIIQASNHIDELAKSINLLSKRLVEWFSYSLPEPAKRIQDYGKISILVAELDRDSMMQQLAILEESTMGSKLEEKDESAVREFAKAIKSLIDLKESQEKYLERLMQENAPNINAIVGSQIGAKLISISGGLKNLAGFPASTVQLLGAEKALFRHMVTGARPPKHGVLHEHYLVSRSREKGRVARAVANKLAIAAKVDYFKGEFIGEKLREELEKKFR